MGKVRVIVARIVIVIIKIVIQKIIIIRRLIKNINKNIKKLVMINKIISDILNICIKNDKFIFAFRFYKFTIKLNIFLNIIFTYFIVMKLQIYF